MNVGAWHILPGGVGSAAGRRALILLFAFFTGTAFAADEIVISVKASDGETVRYVLTTTGAAPRYAVILMPGGRGELPLRQADGPLVSALTDDFLIRSRTLFADSRFVAASTAATATPARILAIEHDLDRRFGPISVYVIGTSRSTEATQTLAAPLDGQVAGFVHTSSMKEIAAFDPRKFRSRHLLVANRRDACRVTPPSSAIAAHETYGADLLLVDGGKSMGDDCSPSAYHGYNGIERETVDKIKDWIAAGR